MRCSSPRTLVLLLVKLEAVLTHMQATRMKHAVFRNHRFLHRVQIIQTSDIDPCIQCPASNHGRSNRNQKGVEIYSSARHVLLPADQAPSNTMEWGAFGAHARHVSLLTSMLYSLPRAPPLVCQRPRGEDKSMPAGIETSATPDNQQIYFGPPNATLSRGLGVYELFDFLNSHFLVCCLLSGAPALCLPTLKPQAQHILDWAPHIWRRPIIIQSPWRNHKPERPDQHPGSYGIVAGTIGGCGACQEVPS